MWASRGRRRRARLTVLWQEAESDWKSGGEGWVRGKAHAVLKATGFVLVFVHDRTSSESAATQSTLQPWTQARLRRGIYRDGKVCAVAVGEETP